MHYVLLMHLYKPWLMLFPPILRIIRLHPLKLFTMYLLDIDRPALIIGSSCGLIITPSKTNIPTITRLLPQSKFLLQRMSQLLSLVRDTRSSTFPRRTLRRTPVLFLISLWQSTPVSRLAFMDGITGLGLADRPPCYRHAVLALLSFPFAFAGGTGFHGLCRRISPYNFQLV